MLRLPERRHHSRFGSGSTFKNWDFNFVAVAGHYIFVSREKRAISSAN
jgi:hypothetical protein